MRNQPENINRFEEFIAHVMKTQAAEGLAVSVINSDGTVLYEKCFGYRDRAASLPMTADTLMGVASVSKSFTALAIMQLCERGIIEADAPVSRYLPDLKRDDIKIFHMLSHTSGFYPLMRKEVSTYMEKTALPAGVDPYRSPEVAEAALRDLLEEMNAQTEFTGRPGEHFSYSNDCFALLSEIIRLYGGEPTYSEYVEKNILLPLGMTDSGARLVWPGGNISRMYQVRDGKMADDWTMFDGQSPHPGAGGIKSTLNDMKKYALMYLNRGKSPGGRILSSYGIGQMLRPQIVCEPNSYYGFGLRSITLDSMTAWGHGGDQPGVASQIDWSYESGIAVVVLCNTSQVASSAISKMALRLTSGLSAEDPDGGLEPVEWDEETMDDVCGHYHDAEGTDVLVSKAGHMFRVSVDGAETVAFPVNRYMLRVKMLIEDMIVPVYRDDDGKVYALGGGYRIIPKVGNNG